MDDMEQPERRGAAEYEAIDWRPAAPYAEEAADGAPARGENRFGRARAMTVFSLLRPGGGYLQRLVFGIGSTRPPNAVRRLSFIHFARMVIIRSLPHRGKEREDIREPLLLFESSYNGTLDQYIDTFSKAIPTKMEAFWRSSYGFPGV